MLRIANVEKTLDFYEKLFGMKLTSIMKLPDSELYFVSDEIGATKIEFTYNFDTPEEGYDIGNGFGHLAFDVDSIEDFSLKMQSFKYGSIEDIYEMPDYDLRIAFLKDPNGYSIELVENR